MKKEKQFEYVISACLLGIPCRWNKKTHLNKNAFKFFLEGRAILLCPEIMAGLSTPRPACEIVGGDGVQVLRGLAKILDKKGKNYTKIMTAGASTALNIVKKLGIKNAILKRGSPTCGTPYIYDGRFSGNKKTGIGVFAALLKNAGIKITGAK